MIDFDNEVTIDVSDIHELFSLLLDDPDIWGYEMPIFGSPYLIRPKNVISWDDEHCIVGTNPGNVRLRPYSIENYRIIVR